MIPFGSVTQSPIATIDVDGRPFTVTVRTAHDGVEFVGRLWFADLAWANNGIPDRGVLPGRTADEVLALAQRLTPEELLRRYRRRETPLSWPAPTHARGAVQDPLPQSGRGKHAHGPARS
jgi:hypothetical protein